jgi:sarcosine oxidase subunit delta
MRIECPLCGERDMREFYYKSAALERPDGVEWSAAWDDYLHNRENPAGEVRELWQHASGCRAWLLIRRNTVTHAVCAVTLAGDAAGNGGGS